MLPDPELEWLATTLRSALEHRKPIAPLTDRHPSLTVAEAYAIAQRNVRARVDAGATVVGHKIGLTSTAVQAQLRVDQPDYGTLLDDMEIPDGGVVAANVFIAPRVEVELAFRLGSSLAGPGVTAADVRDATDSVMAAIEVVDSRISDWRICLADTVADAASSAAYVVGAIGRSPHELPLADLAATLSRGGEVIETGHTSAVLGDPCTSVAWLANALAAVGTTLERGQLVLSGACTRMVAVAPGDSFTAALDGLGEVRVSFAPLATGGSL